MRLSPFLVSSRPSPMDLTKSKGTEGEQGDLGFARFPGESQP